MKEQIDISNKENFSPQQLVQIKIIESVFSTFTLTTKQQEGIGGLSHHTFFTRAVRTLVPMLWNYTPDPIKKKIKELYDKLEIELKELRESKGTQTWEKKIDSMRVAEDQIATEIFNLLILTLTQSPIAQSSETFSVNSDEDVLPELIQATRSEKQVDLFGV